MEDLSVIGAEEWIKEDDPDEEIKSPFFYQFDNRVFPHGGEAMDELERRLRFSKQEELSRVDMLKAASVVSAYRTMIWTTNKDRNVIVKKLREIERLVAEIERMNTCDTV